MLGLPEWASPTALLARARALLRGLRERADLEREMRDEFQHHVAARTDDLIREGLTPVEAQRRARREFGHEGTLRAEARDAMGLTPLAQIRFSWLDVTIGLRLLRKHPMLNLAAVFALAVGIPVGLAPSHVARALDAPLPGDPDHRVRAIRHWDPRSSGVAATFDADFTHWAGTLRSFTALAAFRTASHNLSSLDAQPAPAAGAQLSASVFQVLGARAALGRVFDDGDFAPGAADVVVIGHGLWASRFGRDPQMLGRSIRIGHRLHQVVGVMPEGFAFPNNESFWLPLRLASVSGEREPQRVNVIGRLADGVSVEEAQAELSAQPPPPPIGVNGAADAAERALLRPEVVPFSLLYMGLPAAGLASLPEFRIVQALMFTLLLVACGNVAMLVFARTATRLRELAIRSALGASRTRLVSQVFVEALLLGLIGAGVGVLAIDWALDHVNLAALAGEAALPYWLSLDLTRRTAFTALAFAVISATVAGVIPAIAITGRAITQHIAGAPRARFGRVIASLVVLDVAVSVAAVGMALTVWGHATDARVADHATGVRAEEFLAVEFRLGDDASGWAADQRALIAALELEPGVRRVAAGDVLPRMEHRSRPYELDGVTLDPNARRRWVRVARVDVTFMDALGTPILSGRDFTSSDVDGAARVAIVNTAFVAHVLEGRDPIGRRLRFPVQGASSAGDSAWHEIVGVVGPLGVNLVNVERGEAVYLPAAAGAINPLRLAVHSSVPPLGLTSRVREIAAAVDPEIVMGSAAQLSDLRQGDWYLVMGIAVGLLILAAVLVAMATSGLYAMLSLTVSERTREIGIRSALGASRGALLLAILRRPLVQIGLGAAIGLPLAARFVFELTVTRAGAGSLLQAMAVALGLAMAIVLLVGLGSCLVPTRRILAIEASEAMRAEG